MNKSMKKLCVLVASALSVANVNNSQAMNMKKCNVQKFQDINSKFSNMLENEIENNNKINNTYGNDRPGPSENGLIQRSNSNESENENNTSKYEDLIFEQVDNFEINSNDDDETIYNDDYNKMLKSDDFEKNKEEYKNRGHRNDSLIIVGKDNSAAMKVYCPEPDKLEFTTKLDEMLKSNEKSSIVGRGDIKDHFCFPFGNFDINQSAINSEFLPEYPSPDESFGNNASMQNNNNSPDYAQTTVPCTAEDAYVKCFEMTSKNFNEQLEKYNKNKHDCTVDYLVALGNSPDSKVRYYSINLSEYPNPISVCFVARVYSDRNGSWENYIFKNHCEITKNLSDFDNNTKWIIQNEINRLAKYESKSFTFDIDKKHRINQANLTGGFTLVSRID